jgi:ribosomal protein L12E/L44/L45/RPP1/RPP2
MASVAVSNLSAVEKEQLAISYAAFVLSGTGAQVTQDSLNAVLKAAGVTVSAGLVNAVAKSLKTKKVTEFFGSVGSGSGSAPVAESKPKTEAKPVAPKK